MSSRRCMTGCLRRERGNEVGLLRMKQEHQIQLLRRAARTGDVRRIVELAKSGADLNHVEKHGGFDQTTLLHLAAASHDCSASVLLKLIELGADPDLDCSQSGGPPFLVAAQRHALEKLLVLRKAGADIHRVSKGGMNALVSAAYGPKATMQEVLRVFSDWGVSLNVVSDYGESALSVLSHRGLFQSVEFLLQRGADPSPLHWSTLHYQAACVLQGSKFESCGEDDLETKDGWDRTPLHVAAVAGNIDMVSRLVSEHAHLTAKWRCEQNVLHAAVTTDSHQVVSRLLALGLKVDLPDEFGQTPLMRAFESDAVQSAKVLLDAGASLTAGNSVQDCAVHFARTIPAFELLYSRGCDFNVISGQGLWPLHVAAESGDAALVSFLVEHGARVDLTSTGETALHAAVRSDNAEVVRLLLESGANPNAQDVDGWTPLFCLRSPGVAKLLLEQGASPSIPDQAGMTPTAWIKDPEILSELGQNVRRNK